eukprot:UN17026
MRVWCVIKLSGKTKSKNQNENEIFFQSSPNQFKIQLFFF